ncbi:ABC transporter substrate-binding protein [Paenibacillus sp. NPDC056579]|uniref:ABC transporter substrate-binding protein n=1 Tax=unclassified Paenibacillus TaxID=185978 RepID=UPI001EF995DA|nr:extracellular solute-binding protein [Paenibacillus sp. H1-7]ULL15179.1 extracellular solute-binding protein [Paenibacillus sp. H1-7]
MIKKRETVWLSCLLIGALLNGCSRGEPIEPAGDPASQKPKDPITLTWYFAQSSLEATLDPSIQEALKAKFPHITLNFINRGKGSEYADLIAQGTLPDIIYESTAFTTSRVITNGFHYDLQELVKKHNFDLGSIEPNVLAHTLAQNSEKKLYSLPFTMNKYALFYNKDIFDRFGVAYPKDGMTWDDVYELSRLLTREDGAVTYQGFTTQPNNIMLNNQLSISPLHTKEDKATIHNDGYKLLYDNLRRFFEIPGAIIAPLGDFSKGTIATMVNSHSAIVGAVRANPQLNWDVVSVPGLKERPNTGFKPATLSLFVAQTSKYKDEAFEVISYMLSEEMQTLLSKNGQGTTLKSAAVKKAFGQNVPEWAGKNVGALFYYPDAPPMEPRDSKLTDVGVDFGSSFATMIKDKTDSNTALRSFEEEINKAIEAAKAAKEVKAK